MAKMSKTDKWLIRFILLCGLYFIIRCFTGCSPVPCMAEHKKFQRHWYDETRCKKRSNAKMWWLEHGQQGLILSKNEERKLYR